MFELFLEKSRALIRFAALSSLTTVFKPLFFCPLIGELELFTHARRLCCARISLPGYYGDGVAVDFRLACALVNDTCVDLFPQTCLFAMLLWLERSPTCMTAVLRPTHRSHDCRERCCDGF